MDALFLALIQQLNGAIFVLVVILILCFWLMFKAGSIVTLFTQLQGKGDKIDGQIDSIKDNLSSIKATTDLLYQAHLTTVKSASPVNLTPIGKEISDAISVKQKVQEHWAEIRNEIEKRKHQNPYDVQVAAMEIAQVCFEHIFTETEQNNVKTYAYQKGMNLLEIFPVIGVEIRDKYMSEEGMAVEDIDKNDPSRTQ